VAEIPDEDLAALLAVATVAVNWHDGRGHTSGLDLIAVIARYEATLRPLLAGQADDHTAPYRAWTHDVDDDPEAYIGWEPPLERRGTYQPQHLRWAA
jgi:hypothetical protein